MPIIVDAAVLTGSGLDLKAVWLNVAANSSDMQAFRFMSSLTVATEQPGEVRLLANGRRRLIRRAGVGRKVGLSLVQCDRAQVEWLEDRVGHLMCVRDDRGRKMFGTYFTVDVTEAPYSTDRADVAISLAQVSYSEAV